ncbi:MAG TPA: MFS transporter [Thermoanaerobaculia bacterium]|jgi:predicted MFS family arabinose efflux permease|nr:MFS transporter [Thermoanaerobaculia bacterium]
MLKYWKDLRHLPRPVWVVAASQLVNRAGSMVLSFLVLYLTRERGFSPEHAGFILFLYGAGSIVSAPLAGRLADRWGTVPMMRASLLCSGTMLLVYPLAHATGAIIAVTVALAMLTEAFRPAAMSFFAEMVEPARRKSAFAVYRLAINLGMAIGPAVGGILATISFRYLFLADGATSLAAGLLLAAAALPRRSRNRLHRPTSHPSTSPRLRLATAAHADPRFLFFLAGVLPVTVVFFQHISSMPLFIVRDLGLPVSTFGLLFSLNCLLIVVLEIPLNAITAHWPHRRTLAIGAILSGAGFGAMALARGFWGLAATVVLWTFGEMLFFPASAAYATDIAPDERRGEYTGIYTMVFSLAFAIGPWAGIFVLERAGARVLWGLTFVLGVIAAATFLRLPEPARHSEAEQALPDAAAPALE